MIKEAVGHMQHVDMSGMARGDFRQPDLGLVSLSFQRIAAHNSYPVLHH
jgi:hypothetical protein